MRNYFQTSIVLWTVLVIGTLVFNLYVMHIKFETPVQTRSEAFFNLPANTSRWDANRGLAYVPTVKTMHSNPYPTHTTRNAIADGGNITTDTPYNEDDCSHNKASVIRMVVIYSLIYLAGGALLLYFMLSSRKHRQVVENKNRELQELNFSKDKFFSVMAHDLKTPAANIESLSETLKLQFEVLSKEDRRSCIDLLVESAKIHNELLNTMLDLSRLRTGSKHYQPELVDMSKLVDEVLEQTKLQAQQKQIVQENRAGECFARADRNMITTVMRNIVVNAVKFTHPGGQIVICSEKNGAEVTVSIADTGVGISESRKSGIFEVEHNKSTHGTANESGTGLGLVLCKEYVERHGGRIWFESEQGVGTTFFFTLPAA